MSFQSFFWPLNRWLMEFTGDSRLFVCETIPHPTSSVGHTLLVRAVQCSFTNRKPKLFPIIVCLLSGVCICAFCLGWTVQWGFLITTERWRYWANYRAGSERNIWKGFKFDFLSLFVVLKTFLKGRIHFKNREIFIIFSVEQFRTK